MLTQRFAAMRRRISRLSSRVRTGLFRLTCLIPGGVLEIRDNALYGLLPHNATMELVATGFRIAEGPVWVREAGYLLFTDIGGNRILQITTDGHMTVFRRPSGNANGLTRDGEGRLITCEHGNRRITRTESDGSMTILADSFTGKKLNSPNDVVVKSDGTIYFTDPPSGIHPSQQELPHQGVYRLHPERSEITLVADDFVFPNGLAFSPDETRLYIDDSCRCHIRVFDILSDGMLGNGRLFHTMQSRETTVPDGMKVDVHGNVYCTGPGGVWVFDAEGRHLGTIRMPEQATNCAWGGEDLQTLYITSRTSVYRMRTNAVGSR